MCSQSSFFRLGRERESPFESMRGLRELYSSTLFELRTLTACTDGACTLNCSAALPTLDLDPLEFRVRDIPLRSPRDVLSLL